jgi:hypothetical protein
LTDRAVLHGDLEAQKELSLHRPDKITASKEQRAAALAAGLRAPHTMDPALLIPAIGCEFVWSRCITDELVRDPLRIQKRFLTTPADPFFACRRAEPLPSAWCIGVETSSIEPIRLNLFAHLIG